MGTKIPLYGVEDWFSRKHLTELENLIAGEYACVTNTTQTAIQACLELMGTRSSVIPVILPVTAPPDTIAGVLRAGAHPLLLDIDENTLQIDPAQLRDVLVMLKEAEEEKVPVVLFNKPFGLPISDDLLVQVQDLPTVCDSRQIPHANLEVEDLQCAFNIFSLTAICGAGAVVIHSFPAQVSQLKAVRSGPMGLAGALSEQQAKHVHAVLKSYHSDLKLYGRVIESMHKYASAINIEVMPISKGPAPMWLKVPNARKIVAHLASYDIEAAVGLYPLHNLDEIRRRYVEEPEYPVAESLENRFVCIPTHQDVLGKEKMIIERVSEVNE